MSVTATKKAACALRSNLEAIRRAFEGGGVVLARVDGCLGNSQFRLKFSDGREGRGTPLGKFTFATLRIAPGQIVICEPGKLDSVLTIVGRFDRHKDVAQLVKQKLIPKSLLVDGDQDVCFEDGFEFDDAEEEENKKETETDIKLAKLVNKFTKRPSVAVSAARALEDELDGEAIAYAEMNEGGGVEKRKRKAAAPSSRTYLASPKISEPEPEPEIEQRKIKANWDDDDDIDIDAI
jgi:translation initiation factor IF-1